MCSQSTLGNASAINTERYVGAPARTVEAVLASPKEFSPQSFAKARESTLPTVPLFFIERSCQIRFSEELFSELNVLFICRFRSRLKITKF